MYNTYEEWQEAWINMWNDWVKEERKDFYDAVRQENEKAICVFDSLKHPNS